MFAGVKRAIALGVGRWVGTALGASIAALIFAHAGLLSFIDQACTYISTPATMTAGFGALGMALGCLFFNIKDKTNVNGKMAVTASAAYDQGVQAQSTTDQSKVVAVAQAMKAADIAAPADKAQVLSALKSGTF